jgi:L-ascorbate metabolism protein UlaG (beta-lactamase superfamily)
MKTTVILLLSHLLIPLSAYSQIEAKITYISNEGFLIEASGQKVLIDGLFDKIDGDWCDSPSENMVESLSEATAPFDSVDLIAITHKHRDHFSESVVVNHLLSNPTGIVICPKQVGEILLKNPDYEEFSDRIIALTPHPYTDTNIVVSDISVKILRLEHSHSMEEDSTGAQVNRHRNIENLGYLITVNGITLFHCGDANPLNEKEYSTFSLNNEAIDIAFLDMLFFGGETGTKVVNNHIAPDKIVVMHINSKNKTLFIDQFKSNNNILVFKDKLDSITLNLFD